VRYFNSGVIVLEHEAISAHPKISNVDMKAVAGSTEVERHVVLVAPEVHWNTGNIGRTCLGVGAVLHLIRPLGFSLDHRHVKRAGLDYWHRVPLRVWDNFHALEVGMQPRPDELALFSKNADNSFWNMPFCPRQFLVFGSETHGLPEALTGRFARCAYHIPISRQIRCLNLSTAVGIALYESLRPCGLPHAWRG
jgi:tRNA (cytidine/uridine-2'-O-)-methyltransferase